MEAGSTYRAVQAVSRGRLELTEKTLHAPGPGKVRIRVEACGVCHSDSGTVEALFPIEWPRVPGHEVVGLIDALGPGVQGPSASISPTTSWPGTRGHSIGNRASTVPESEWQTPQASTRIRTLPGPGACNVFSVSSS